MRGIILSILLFFGIAIIQAQNNDANAFQQSEDLATGTTSSSSSIKDGVSNGVMAGNFPNEEDPLEAPIDDYLPLLFIAGVALVLYQYQFKKTKSI